MAQNNDGTWNGFPYVLYQLLATDQRRGPDWLSRPDRPELAEMQADVRDYLERHWPLYFGQHGKPI
jgi:hypothetical protein